MSLREGLYFIHYKLCSLISDWSKYPHEITSKTSSKVLSSPIKKKLIMSSFVNVWGCFSACIFFTCYHFWVFGVWVIRGQTSTAQAVLLFLKPLSWISAPCLGLQINHNTFVNCGHLKKITAPWLKNLIEYSYLLPKYSVKILREKKWAFSFYFTFCERGILHVSLWRVAL